MTLAISIATEHSLDEDDVEVAETQEWIEALDEVIEAQGPERAQYLLKKLQERGHERALDLPFTANTPYVNTIPRSKQPPYPGDRKLERRIKSLIRWNAMAMVVRANKQHPGIGGHISTFASAATLYQVPAPVGGRSGAQHQRWLLPARCLHLQPRLLADQADG